MAYHRPHLPLYERISDYLFNMTALTRREARQQWRDSIKEAWNNRCAYCGQPPIDDDSLTELTIKINTGDIVLLFTDGITEATNAEGEMFSQVRLEQALNKYADLPVRKVCDKIIEEVMSYQKKQLDDITLVVIKK